MSKSHNSRPFFMLFLGVILAMTAVPPLIGLLGLSFCSPIQGGPGAYFAGLTVGNTMIRVDLIVLGFGFLVALLTFLYVRTTSSRFTTVLGATVSLTSLVSGIQIIQGMVLPEGSITFFDQILPATMIGRLGNAAICVWGLSIIRWGHHSCLKVALRQFLLPTAGLIAATWFAMSHYTVLDTLLRHGISYLTLGLYGLSIILLQRELRHHRPRFFGHGILAAAIPLSVAELLLTFTAHTVVDSAFNIATMLRWFGWMIPAAALSIDYVNTFYTKDVSLEMRYLRTVIDSIPHYIFARDTNGRYTLVNQAVADFYGLEVHEIEGRHLMDVHHLADQCHEWLAEDKATIAMGKKNILPETVATRANGLEVWINSIKTPLPSPLGITDQVLGVSIDISEQRRAERALAEALEGAKASNKAKTEFLANMSHEIRTPMNCVIGLTDLLKEMDPSPQQQQYLDMIRISGATLLTLINDILDISKIEAGHLELDLVDTDLQTLVEETVNLIAFSAQTKGLDVVCRLAPGMPSRLMLDPGRLRQVLTNLLNNATKFTQNGHVYLNIEPVGEHDGQIDICFRVVDTGIGIAQENLDRIFEKFTQAEAGTTRRFGGTGLGLSISQHLVNLMGGEVTATSEAGVGTTFSFSLALKPTATGLQPTLNTPTSEHRVLVVTDHELSGEVLVEQVRSLGHICRLAVGDQAAHEALQITAGQEDWTFLLVDQRIAENEATAMHQHLDSLPADRQPRTIMLVELARLNQKDQLDQLGFDDVLHKPVRLSQLAGSLAGRQTVLQQQPALAIRETTAPDTTPTDGPRLLLAEDNPFNQKVAVAMLRKLGCQVDVAGTGVEAVDMARRKEYALILMDCQMPVMDGYEATRRIRQLPLSARDGRIIAMTANALSGDRRACFAAGMNDFMSKPITSDLLREMLVKWDVLAAEPEAVQI